MRIAVIGATGMAGSRIAAEGTDRGHIITGISRTVGAQQRAIPGPTFCSADATDSEAMARVAAEHDVIVVATRPEPGTEDDVGTSTTIILDAAKKFDRRVLVIGGAGPLRSPDDSDRLVIDDERFVPEQWRAIAQASVEQFKTCVGHLAAWTYLSPPALFAPGERTGTYRRGGGTLLIDPKGVSRISAEDLAIAAVDELENPQPGLRHFTVAY